MNSLNEDLHKTPDKTATTLEQIAALRRIGLLSGDFRAYSTMLHELGSIYYKHNTSFETLDQRCPRLVKDGCVHGYVMEYFSDNGVANTQALCQSSTQFRLRIGCFHAIGHSYAENTSDSLLKLNDICKYSVINEVYVPCYSGVLHEYIRGSANSHNHSVYYEKSTSHKNIDCTIFSQTSVEYALCYAAIGSFRQYDQYSEPTETTRKMCLTALNESAEQLCIQMVNERISISRGYSFIPY